MYLQNLKRKLRRYSSQLQTNRSEGSTHHCVKKTQIRIYTVGGLLLVSALYFSLTVHFRDISQKSTLLISPSAERAYAYGNEKFDAQLPRDYDPEHAQRLYELALQLDPAKPYVRHQLARLEFLKGNFDSALMLIDEEIAMPGGPASPSSYYVRGLINGFAGNYSEAIHDYETYLRTDPKNWAAINDYAWVMLKAGKQSEALIAVDWGLLYWPQNPWLLNTKAIAHYELGDTEKAFYAIISANEILQSLTAPEWSKANPGNDPLIAQRGVDEFQKSVNTNMHTIFLSRTSLTEVVR